MPDFVQTEIRAIEDHLRIWDTTDLPYRLSLTYCARVIGIEPAVAEGASIVTSAQLTGTTP